ncbi:hypothetical protein C4J81_06630 [Deltaproteobacteria bacterium Smac51]|nr:hypothetical protein C4J81_06630 [Deltaproteobacteria bacterium Smac51]
MTWNLHTHSKSLSKNSQGYQSFSSSSLPAIHGWLKDCCQLPPKCPLFNRGPDLRLMRSQRREACLALLLALLRHLDPTTLCIGFLHPNGLFQSLAMKHIVLETGLGRRRCERVIADLKRIEAVEMRSPGHCQPPALAFTPRFMEWMLWAASLWALERGQSAAPSAFDQAGGRS